MQDHSEKMKVKNSIFYFIFYTSKDFILFFTQLKQHFEILNGPTIIEST